MKANKNLKKGAGKFILAPINVFSRGGGCMLLNHIAENFADRTEDLAEEEARFREVKRVLSTFGYDKRDEINQDVISIINQLILDETLKMITAKKHPEEKGVHIYQVSGSKLEQKKSRNGTYEFTPRSGLNAILVVKRQDEDGKLNNSIDIIEYKDGEPVVIIAGGMGESVVEDIGEIARGLGICILARTQLTNKETKALEKEAAETIQEAFEDAKKTGYNSADK